MTVTSTTSRWEAVGNGSTTVFPYNNKIFEDTDLKVYLDGVLQTLTTHYTVSGAGTDSGGNVTFVTPPGSGVSVVIVRAVANTQEIDYPPGGAFPANSTEDGLDRRTIISQQNVSILDRAIQYLESDASLPSPILPTLDSIKGKYLRFNSATGAPEAGVFDSGTTSRTAQNLSGDDVQTTFTLSPAATSGASVDVYISGVHQDPGNYTVSGSSIAFTTPPPSGTDNILVVVSEEVPIGVTSSDLVTYLQEGATATSRSVQDRLRDRASVEDYGTAQQAVDTARTIYFGPGTYTGSITLPASMALEADTTADLTGLTFTGSLRKGNRFTFGGDYEPTLGQLGHPAPNKGNSWQNALQVTRGTATAPDTTALYARTAVYVEMHTNKVHSVAQSSWGNSFKTPALTVENIVHDTFEGEGNGGAFRAYSTDPPASATASKRILVGVSAVGQTNTGSGNDAWSVWGANFVAAQTSGNAPNNCIGIEVDVVHVSDATSATGPSTGNNFTGYWAQADGDGVFSTAAFYASRSARSSGWNYVFYSTAICRNWMIYVSNPSAGGQGIYTETSGAAVTALEATTEGYNTTSGNGPNGLSVKSQNSGVVQSNFVVTSNADNPINVRVGGSLKQVTQGAADSGGAGFRLLRVAN